MDAVNRFVRSVPLAALVWAAGGCEHTSARPPADAPPPSVTPAGAGPGQRTASLRDHLAGGGMPTARPQAPGEPQPPAGPVAPPDPVPPPAAPAPVGPAGAAGPDPAAAVVPAGAPTPDRATTQIKVVALIGADVVITDDEVWPQVRQRAKEYLDLTDGAARDAREKEIFREELRRLIDRELILAEFLGRLKKQKPRVLDTLQEEAARSATKRMRDVRKQLGEDGYTQYLRFVGLSPNALQRHLERDAMLNIYLGEMLKDKGGKNVTLADVQRYYDAHPAEFQVADRVKWLDLFVSYSRFASPDHARQAADALARQAAGGADFAQLVKDHGHGDSPLRNGEGLGQKRGEVDPRELEPTLFRLAPGQVAGPVATPTGLHVVKVVERDEAGAVPLDDKTQTAIRAKLTNLAREAEYARMVEDLWRKTGARVLADR